MTEYAIVLDFKNAKLFPETNDNYQNNFKVNPETLWYSHVCNALHVLLGHRPVPTIRKLIRPLEYGWIPEIVEVAKNALVRIDSPVVTTTFKGKEIPFTEIFAGTKPNGSIGGSGPTDKGCSKPIMLGGVEKKMETAPLNWDRMRYYLEDAWGDFEKVVLEVVGAYENKSVYEVLSILHDYHKNNTGIRAIIANAYDGLKPDELVLFLKNYYSLNKNEVGTCLDKFFRKYYIDVPKGGLKIGKPIYEIIANGNTKDQFFHQSGYGLLATTFIKFVLHSPEQVTTLSGKIYLKVSQDIVDRLREYGRTSARLLEGGLVTIEELEDLDTFNWTRNTANTEMVQTEI